NTIGLPPENNLGIFFAEIPLQDRISQVWVNGIGTRGTGVALAGAYNDPDFGVIETKNYSEIGSRPFDFNGTEVFDSVVLQIRVSSIYGNNVEDKVHDLEIFQLADSITDVENGEPRAFTTATTEDLGPQIGIMSQFLFPDSVNLFFSQTGISLNDGNNDSADSAFFLNHFDNNQRYIYMNETKLDDTYGSEIFNQLISPQYDSAGPTEIAALFKGLHIRGLDVNGAIVTYDITDPNSGIRFYYTDGGEQESILFPFTRSRSYNNIAPNKNSGWTGSPLDNISQFFTPYETSDNLAYIQSGTNMLAKIDLSDFKQFKDSIPDAIIQSAKLFISGSEPPAGLTAPPKMIYWLTSADSLSNENYNVTNPPNVSRSVQIADYNSDLNGYRTEIPLLMESLTSDDEFEFDQLIIAPVNTTSFTLPPDRVRRFTANKNEIIMHLFYTLPDKNK
ncbi:MAG: hypothetical protein R3345_13460, partial [Fulvivirga sp.]|nr:hypothetical protein [Fulvivirga sp.]